jgi:fimbrial chaperone protein
MKIPNLLLLFSLLLLISAPCNALRFSPMYVELSPTGRQATQDFRVINDTASRMAIQVTIAKRFMNLDGQERLVEEEDDFLVYPPQMIIRPGQTQIVRLQWLGQIAPKKELTYRIIAEQLPINLTAKQTKGVNIVLRYIGSIYVVPKGAKSQVVIDKVAPLKKSKGKYLAITFKNKGNRHTRLDKLQLKLIDTNRHTVTLAGKQLPGIDGQLVFAKQKRRFLLAWPKKLKGHRIRASFFFEPPPE